MIDGTDNVDPRGDPVFLPEGTWVFTQRAHTVARKDALAPQGTPLEAGESTATHKARVMQK